MDVHRFLGSRLIHQPLKLSNDIKKTAKSQKKHSNFCTSKLFVKDIMVEQINTTESFVFNQTWFREVGVAGYRRLVGWGGT